MKEDQHERIDRSNGAGIPAGLSVLAGLAFLGLGAVYVFCTTFSQFRPYDDEGRLMISVQGYLEGNPLYDSVATYYGPFYYFYERLVHGVASIPLTHDATGLMCVFHCLLAATILSLAGWRLTRSLPVLFLVFAQSVVHLGAMCREPGHPQELVVLLLALAALVAAGGTAQRSTLPILGAIGACLVFTKINVGAFFVLALLLALICFMGQSRVRSRLLLVLVSLATLAPFFLMRQHLAEPWARHYCWQACASIMAVSIVAYAYACRGEIGFSDWVRMAMAFAGLSAVFLAILLLTGTSFSAVVYCLVKGPASLANAFCFPLHVEQSSWLVALSLALAITAVAFRRQIDRWLVPISVGKGMYAVIGALILVQDPRRQLGYLLPWVWLVLIPPHNDASTGKVGEFPRGLLCLAAVWQGLQAYPVAGSQVAVGTFLAVLVYSICAYDAIQALSPALCRRLHRLDCYPRRAIVVLRCGFVVVLLAVFTFKWVTPLEHWSYYAGVPPLNLHGAHLVRPDPAQANTYRTLTRYVESACDTFVTVPGLNSLYFWTGKKPPTYINISGEGVMPSHTQQSQIVAALRRAQRPLVVESQIEWAAGVRIGDSKDGPLPLFIHDEYREIKKLPNFRILAPKEAVGYLSASSGR